MWPRLPEHASCWRACGSSAGSSRRRSSSIGSMRMSEVDTFFDTSVLLYLLSDDSEKADRVEQLLAERGTISVQVLNEFAAVALRKLRMPLGDVREILDTVRALCE